MRIDDGIAEAGNVDHGTAIHRQAEGAAEGHVVEGLGVAGIGRLEVHLEGNRFGRRLPIGVVLRVEADIGLVDLRQERAEPVNAPLGQKRQHLVVAGNLRQLQAIDLQGRSVPVVGIAALLVDLRREAADLGHRAGTDRLLVLEGERVGNILPDMLGHDRKVGERFREMCIDALEVDLDLRRRHRLDRGDTLADADDVDRRVLEHQLEGEFHVGRCQRLAVRPLHAIAQRIGDRLQVVGKLVAGCQPPDRLAAVIVVEDHERLIDEVHGALPPPAQVERVEVLHPARLLFDMHGQNGLGLRLARCKHRE